MNERQQAKLNKLIEDHFPSNGFRSLTGYRKAKDAMTRAVLRDPSMLHPSVLKCLQNALSDSARMLLEELEAAKRSIPVELPADGGAQPKMLELQAEEVAEVVPYRKLA